MSQLAYGHLYSSTLCSIAVIWILRVHGAPEADSGQCDWWRMVAGQPAVCVRLSCFRYGRRPEIHSQKTNPDTNKIKNEAQVQMTHMS